MATTSSKWLEAMKIAELKLLLMKHCLPVCGRKVDLMARQTDLMCRYRFKL